MKMGGISSKNEKCLKNTIKTAILSKKSGSLNRKIGNLRRMGETGIIEVRQKGLKISGSRLLKIGNGDRVLIMIDIIDVQVRLKSVLPETVEKFSVTD